MDNRKFPYISFIASCLSVLGLIILTIMLIVVYIEDSNRAYGNSTPLIGLLILCYPIIALYGVVSSWYCGANANTIWLKIVSHIMLIVFSLILLPFCLWFLASIIGLIF